MTSQQPAERKVLPPAKQWTALDDKTAFTPFWIQCRRGFYFLKRKGKANVNINGYARTLKARDFNVEKFLLYVAECIEWQLKEWDQQYEVLVMKLQDYQLIVKYGERDYSVKLSEEEAFLLQKTSPYRLDQEIWKGLEKQDLEIKKGFGNYIEAVL